MEKRFIIRNTKWEDFHDLVRNFYSYYDEVKKDPTFTLTLMEKKPTLQEEAVWFASVYKSILDKERIMLVAEVDGKVVGACEVSRGGSQQGHVGILGIAVKKEYRSMGVGQALIKGILKKSEKKFEIVVLQVFAKNSRAKHVYEKLGFKMYATLKNGIKRNGKYFDEQEMYINLKKFKK